MPLDRTGFWKMWGCWDKPEGLAAMAPIAATWQKYLARACCRNAAAMPLGIAQ